MIDTIPQVDNATINHEMGFVPRKLVPVQVGRLTVELYPKIKPKWPVHERAHAFQVNKAVLKPTPVVIRLILDALGAQLHCSTAVEGLIQEWKDTFETQWVDFNSLTNQTFHNTADNVINDTTTQEDPCVLLPVIDDERANCRKPDVRYVRVQCNVDFCPLVTIDPPGNTTLRVSYYIELPPDTETVNDKLDDAYNLTTFHGPTNLRLLDVTEVQTTILKVSLQTGPITLQPAKFNLQEEQIDETNIRLTIECKILKLAFANICAAIFVELCSGYSSQSHAAIEHIKQTYAGSDGQPVTAQVFEYYQRMLNAVRPFVKERTWPVSVCNRFIGGLDRRIITSFRKHYPDHVTQHNLAGTFQRKQLPQILKGVQLAEDEVHQIQTITRAAVGQGFYCGVTNKNDQPSVSGREYNHQVQGQLSDKASTAVSPTKMISHLCQAENTITKYKAISAFPSVLQAHSVAVACHSSASDAVAAYMA
eukprot:CAMPEP_0183746802 /NCGR_PEP_ID=MMETSP0737-20130205/66943_1 /TAXON_ID=385413 /ORGANISM="Thalassiosira miniscula, Strain CCMP1093" /LENGTH=477 /DNA_ID=CAMNT_0025982507 /DNA_START=949 /DNA_END=2382 /DNA_ORIENTATION=-